MQASVQYYRLARLASLVYWQCLCLCVCVLVWRHVDVKWKCNERIRADKKGREREGEGADTFDWIIFCVDHWCMNDKNHTLEKDRFKEHGEDVSPLENTHFANCMRLSLEWLLAIFDSSDGHWTTTTKRWKGGRNGNDRSKHLRYFILFVMWMTFINLNH